MRVLITGAAGSVGSVLRSGLAGRYDLLRLHDIMPQREVADARVQWMSGDLVEEAVVARAVEGIDVVIHLAGVAREADWPALLRNNVELPVKLFEAAQKAGVRRVVFASSHHAVGFHDRRESIDQTVDVRPDSRYGVTKVFGEALGRYYHDKFGMSVICVRIGAYRPEPDTHRHLMAWLSPQDCVRLFARTIESDGPGFGIFYGASANARGKWTDEASEQLGFVAMDDAEVHAERVLGLPDAEGPVAARYHGGIYAARELHSR